MVSPSELRSKIGCDTCPPWRAELCLGKGGLRLGEPESSYGRLLGDCLKPVCGLFRACHIACFRGYCGWFCEHAICHNWFDDQECYYLPL